MEKAYSSANLGGFKTDRITKKQEVHEFNTERSPREHKELSSSINVYFYKNFNKFIQNLYIQDEKNIQQQLQASKKEEKLVNNPYHKEIVAMSLKRQGTKKPSTAPNATSRVPNTTSNKASDGLKRTQTLNSGKSEPKTSNEIAKKYLVEETGSGKGSKLLKSVSLKAMNNNLSKWDY